MDPCLKGLTRDCFKAHPAFARRAFAYRLLHLLIPPRVARILPKTLQVPLAAPGTRIPLDIDFPPGIVLVPGCNFPAGWTQRDPMPPCAKSMPLPTAAMAASGAAPPTYVAPYAPGPPAPPPAPPPPVSVPYFSETFDTLDPSVWTEWNQGVGDSSIVAAQLKQDAPAGADTSLIYRTHPTTPALAFDFSFMLNYKSGTNRIEYNFRTGTYWIRLRFYGTTKTVDLLTTAGVISQAAAFNFDEDNTWKLVVSGSNATLYRNTTLIFTTALLITSTSWPGRMRIWTYGPGDTRTDDYIIQE